MNGTLWYTGFNESQVKKIKENFEKLLESAIEFEAFQDDSLIGGFVAHIDGVAYDASFKSRLKGIKSVMNGD